MPELLLDEPHPEDGHANHTTPPVTLFLLHTVVWESL